MVGSSVSVSSLAAEARALGALGVAGEGLDLDDLGAHLGQNADSGGSGHVGAHLDDLDAGERTVAVQLLGYRHACVPFLSPFQSSGCSRFF